MNKITPRLSPALHSRYSIFIKKASSMIILFMLSVSFPVSAVLIMAGSDYLQTTEGTYLDFDFPGSPVPGLGIVDFIGKPIGPGNTDTIVKRLDDADLPNNGDNGTIDIEMVALSLRSVDPVNIGGTFFDLGIVLASGFPSIGQMVITLDDILGVSGTFESFFDVFFDVELYLAGTDTLVQTITGLDPLHLQGSGQWGSNPPPGAVILPGTYGDLDANLHNAPDPDYYDFFIEGEIIEEHPGVGVHRAKTATIPEPNVILLFAFGLFGIAARMRKFYKP
jgi:hypothetical protein